MIISVSFRDVLKLDEYKGLTEFDLLPKEVDCDLFPHFFKIGGDIDKTVSIQACKHRDQSGKVALGYRYALFERTDDEWVGSKNCSMSARVSACKDPHLAADLYVFSKQGIGESGFKNMCLSVMGKDGTTKRDMKEMIEEDWMKTRDMIKCLQDIQLAIRGELDHNDDVLFDDEKDLFHA